MNLIEAATRSVNRGGSWLRRNILGRGFVRNVGVMAASRFVEAALTLTQGILVARWLGPEQYGIAVLIMSYPSLLFSFLNTKSHAATIKFISDFEARGRSIEALAMCKFGYGLDIAISMLTFLIVLATAWWAESHVVHASGIVTLMLLYSLSFLPRALGGTSNAVLSTSNRFNVLARINLVVAVVRTGVVLGLVLRGWGISGVIWGNSIGIALSGLLMVIAAYPLIKSKWGNPWIYGSWKDLRPWQGDIFRFLLNTNITELIGAFSKQLDEVLLGGFRGPEEVGFYRLAKSVANVVSYLVSPLQAVAYPKLAKLVSMGRRDELDRVVRQMALLVGGPVGALACLGILFIPWLLPIVAGEAFKPSVLAAQILLFSGAVWLSFFWLRPLFYAQGRVREWAMIMGVMILILVAGFLVVTPLWGYLGMAAWLAFMQVFGHGVAATWISRRHYTEANGR